MLGTYGDLSAAMRKPRTIVPMRTTAETSKDQLQITSKHAAEIQGSLTWDWRRGEKGPWFFSTWPLFSICNMYIGAIFRLAGEIADASILGRLQRSEDGGWLSNKRKWYKDKSAKRGSRPQAGRAYHQH